MYWKLFSLTALLLPLAGGGFNFRDSRLIPAAWRRRLLLSELARAQFIVEGGWPARAKKRWGGSFRAGGCRKMRSLIDYANSTDGSRLHNFRRRIAGNLSRRRLTGTRSMHAARHAAIDRYHLTADGIGLTEQYRLCSDVLGARSAAEHRLPARSLRHLFWQTLRHLRAFH